MRTHSIPTLAAIALLLSSPALIGQSQRSRAQGSPVAGFKLVSINITGETRYPPADIISATGLQVGQTVSDADFKQATATLGETGAFQDVLYSYQYSAEGAKLELKLSDNAKFVPVRFDNIVWFSDKDLLEKLHAQVPLFYGELPLAGNLADQVSTALQALLIQNKIPGEADYLRSDDSGQVDAIVFSVTGPRIIIDKIEFAGAGPDETPLLQSAAEPVLGKEYLQSLLRLQAEKAFRRVYRQHGYLKAVFGDPQPHVTQQTPEQTSVDVTMPVTPGQQYKLAGIAWSGNKLFPAAKLQSLVPLKDGQPVDEIELENDLQALKDLYGTQGYMGANARLTPQMDADATVRYTIAVEEGPVYHMGELEIRGLDSRMHDTVNLKWTLREGDVYDSSYPKRLIDQLYRDGTLDNSLNVKVQVIPDDRDQTVDVTLRFESRR